MTTYDEHLTYLAEHPADTGAHAVFADWLLEHGDSRGEALALELSGQHSRLGILRRKHEAQWLGPLAEWADASACEFYGAFPTKVAFKRGAAGGAFEQLPPTVKHLSADWRALARAPKLKLDTLEVIVGLGMAFSDFRALAEELDAVAHVEAPQLSLMLDTFIGVEAAQFLAEGFLRSALCNREHVTLIVREGSLDAACAWLYEAHLWGGGERWGAKWGGAIVSLGRDEHGRFTHVYADVSFDDQLKIAARVGSIASVLSQLRRLNPTRIEVKVREGQRVAKRLIDLLDAPRRFLPFVDKIRVVRKK